MSTLESCTASLPGETTICTVELWAIKLALDTVANTDYICYTIYSDSKSALDAINRFEPQSYVAAEIILKIHNLKSERGK